MFRSSDKKQSGKQAINEAADNQTTSYQTQSSSWQQQPAATAEPQSAPPAPPTPVQTPTQPRAIGERDAMARDIKDGVLNGFVGNGTVMAGEAIFKGMLRVDGHLTGRITSEDGTLLVGANGQVDANVEVSVATIHGTINGDIVATKRIEMGRSAKVVGNIQTPALIIEPGAVFEGSCRMQVKEAADNKPKEKAKQTQQTLVAPTSELLQVSDISEVAS